MPALKVSRISSAVSELLFINESYLKRGLLSEERPPVELLPLSTGDFDVLN